MKLFLLAALIAVSSAARLEHLERGYLPPDQANQGRAQSHGHLAVHSQAFGNQGTIGSAANHADSTSFASSPVGIKSGAAAFRLGSSLSAATSNQYLPPDHGPSANAFPRPHGGAHSQDAFGASSNQNQFSAQPSVQYGAPQFGQGSSFGSQGSSSFGSQGSSGFGSQKSSGFGSHGSTGFGSHGSSGFGSQGSTGFGSQGSSGFGSHGSSGLGSQSSNVFGSHGSSASHGSTGVGSHASNGFGSSGSSGFGSQGSSGFGSHGSGFGAQGSNIFRSQQANRFDASRQYLAPKTSSSFDKIPQQSFDEETGYHY